MRFNHAAVDSLLRSRGRRRSLLPSWQMWGAAVTYQMVFATRSSPGTICRLATRIAIAVRSFPFRMVLVPALKAWKFHLLFHFFAFFASSSSISFSSSAWKLSQLPPLSLRSSFFLFLLSCDRQQLSWAAVTVTTFLMTRVFEPARRSPRRVQAACSWLSRSQTSFMRCSAWRRTGAWKNCGCGWPEFLP